MSQLRVKLLWGGVGVLLLCGAGLFSLPFFFSLGINARAENDSSYAVDLSSMRKGEYREYTYFSVYRRTDQDKLLADKNLELLQDPNSLESSQPDSARNIWRSESKDFFVFYPYSPKRGCTVRFTRSNSEPNRGPENRSYIDNSAYFYEICEGRTWDTSGRLVKKPHSAPEENLIVPEIKWYSSTSLVVP